MKAAVKAQLISNLKVLKLSAVLSHLEAQLRQAHESNEDYAEFLLNLSDLEVTARMENGFKRRIHCYLQRFSERHLLDCFDRERAF